MAIDLIKRLYKLILASGLLFSVLVVHAEQKKTDVVGPGKEVSIEYTVTLDDGTPVHSNVGDKPLVYKHGEKQLFPALEQALAGLKVNDTKKVALSSDEAFGPVDPKAFVEVQPEDIPEDARKAGTLLTQRDASGEQRSIRVHEVREDKIVLDLNHPLAGKNLIFDVRVMQIQ